MGTAAKPGDTTVYSIYWAPSAASYSANYETILDGFLKNVAAASGSKTNVFSVLTQYHGTSSTPTAYSVHFRWAHRRYGAVPVERLPGGGGEYDLCDVCSD